MIQSRVFVSQVLADAPGRAPLQGLQQFNGRFGCSYCLHEEAGQQFTVLKAIINNAETLQTAPIRSNSSWRAKLDRHYQTDGHLTSMAAPISTFARE